MRISDWSSDVCSSDLKIEPIRTTVLPDFTAKVGELITMLNEANEADRSVLIPNGAAIAEKVGQMRTNALAERATAESETAAKDRKSVVYGKSESVRVDLGSSRSLKKKTTNTKR